MIVIAFCIKLLLALREKSKYSPQRPDDNHQEKNTIKQCMWTQSIKWKD